MVGKRRLRCCGPPGIELAVCSSSAEHSGEGAGLRPGLASWISLIYLLLALIYSSSNPLFESPDEAWHVAFAAHLARGGGLPVQRPGEEGPWRQEGSQPPLYYALLAGVTRLLGLPLEDLEQVYVPNPHACLGDATRIASRNQAVHGPEEAFPWRGAVLTLHVWRVVSALLGGLAVWSTVRMVSVLFPGESGWAAGSGLLVALNPMFLFITSSVNNDALAAGMAATVLWLLALRWAKGFSWGRAAMLGLALGASPLAKLSGLTLWPVALAVLLAAAQRERKSRRAVAEALVVFGLSLGACGWWFVRNWRLYGDPTGLRVMLDIFGRRPVHIDILGEFQCLRWSFWGVFGAMNVLMPRWVYAVLDAWVGMAALGLFVLPVRALVRREPGASRAAALGLLGYVALHFVAFLRWTAQTMATQGRLMFPAIGPIALGIWVGWEEACRLLVPTRLRRVALPLPGAFLGTLALCAPFIWIAPAYRPPELPLPEKIANPVAATFGQEFRLLGYEMHPASLHPGEELAVTVYLEALGAPTRDWSMFLHLIDGQQVIVAQEDRYPRQGLVRASHLAPGERWAEAFRLQVPDTVPAPGQLSLRFGFYDLRTWERLRTWPSGDEAVLGEVRLEAWPGPYPNRISYVFGGRIELVGFDMPRRNVRPGETVLLKLYWRALGPAEHDYTVFTHILEPPSTIWGQEDRPPHVPTSRWQAGAVYEEAYALVVKPDAPPGLYEVEVGLYRPETGERLRLPDGRDYVLLGRIRVR